MIRFALRLALLVSLLLSVVLVVAHARSFNPDLNDLLATSPGCNGKGLCFMGIYPGSSTIGQAASVLSHHPWVDQVDTRSYSQISWTWSGKQPAFIDGSVPGSAIERDYQSISIIRLKTRYNYGDIWLQLGTPALGYVMRQPSGLLHGVYYRRYSLLAINATQCPASVNDFWTMPVIVQFGDAFIMLDDHYREQSAPLRACG